MNRKIKGEEAVINSKKRKDYCLSRSGNQFTAWKVFFSGPCFYIFGLNAGKYGSEKAANWGTFHAVISNDFRAKHNISTISTGDWNSKLFKVIDKKESEKQKQKWN